MAEVSLDIADDIPCWECGEILSVEVLRCPSCLSPTVHLDIIEMMDRFFNRRQILDARNGGYIAGYEHPDDNLFMFNYLTGNIFYFSGIMEAGEYVLSAKAAETHREELSAINAESGDATELPLIDLKEFGNVLDVNLANPLDGLSEYCGLLFNRGQAIINRYATKRYFLRLQQLNSSF